jgi:hypothetical protein
LEFLGFLVPPILTYQLWWLRKRLPATDARERVLWASAVVVAVASGISAAARIDALRGVIWGVSTLTALWMAGVVLVTVREDL